MIDKAENKPNQTQGDRPMDWDNLIDYSKYKITRCYRKVVKYRVVDEHETTESQQK